jgi:hypothetical protein
MSFNIPVIEESNNELEILDTEVFTKYLDLLFQKEYKGISVCSTNLVALNEYFIEVNVSEGTYKISNYILTLYEQCNSKNVRFFILPIYLIFPQVYNGKEDSILQSTGHSNAILIDTELKLVEWFEPHGEAYKGHLFLKFNTEKILTSILYDILYDIFPGNYTFKNALEYCDYLAPQKGDRDTYCLGWSLLYIELKLLNPTYSSETIFKLFNERLYTDEKRLAYIQQYIIYVENSVKIAVSKLHSLYKKGIAFNFDDIIINKDDLNKRILDLLSMYKNETNSKNGLGIFYELMGYSKYSKFHNLLFAFLNMHPLPNDPTYLIMNYK